MDGIWGISLFTGPETQEINSLDKLAASLMEKSNEIIGGTTDAAICEGIRNDQMSALETFSRNAPPEAIQVGIVAAAEVICKKSFQNRFREVLLGACINLVGCGEPL